MHHSIILLIIGGLFLGINLGWWPNALSLLSTWWPLILIAVGIAGLLKPESIRCGRRDKHETL
ncbi:LiaI-LiaF-like domain-containing protein [Chitinibacter sp. S2-10]|uniref:LiaI-LiaF-like domain-containing protein n=1 Tax=Chitinibacter sp. S2-10 TaxID=3373597 RepID=UPI003977CA75